ncbi:uncharacterized protein LOC143906624 [Temnothorax americanus]|uniref:uncharacterized protein LOC143906624 n=1 Tax=Temnothorax americanus TaxID=1964332 RepID=UPI004067AD6C
MEKLNDLKSVCDVLHNHTTALTREVEDYCDTLRQLQQRVKSLTEKVPPCLELIVRVDDNAVMLEKTAIMTSIAKKSRHQIRLFVTKLRGMHRDIARLDSHKEAHKVIHINDDVPVCWATQCEKM